MDSRWIVGHEDKEARKKELESYKKAFEALTEILEKHFEDSTPDYANSAWAYKQADVNGANRKLREVLKLIKL